MIPLIQNTVMMDVMRRGGVMLNMKNQLRSLLCLVDQREGQEVMWRNQIDTEATFFH